MKFNLMKKTIFQKTILILLFALLIGCDSMGDSNNEEGTNLPSGAPPTENPTFTPPQTPPSNPSIPQPTTNPPSAPTSPVPTVAPPSPPNPTPMPSQTPQPTTQPTPIPTNPPGGPLNEFLSQVLDLVNSARAQGRNCGSEFFPAAPPVTWDERIQNAAQSHSEDMALNENFSHTGTDGSNAGDRLLIENYNWNTWGENILVGLDDPSDAIDTWIGSIGHCSIIMNSSLRQVGAGVAMGSFQGSIESYWTLLFATEN